MIRASSSSSIPVIAAGFEDEDRLAGQPLRDPALDRAAAKPLVLERAELAEVAEAANLTPGIPSELLRVIEPEGTAGRRIEVPADDVADARVERRARRGRIGKNGCACRHEVRSISGLGARGLLGLTLIRL